jgi:acyl-CoA synthetase (AMP-forming)/AMP-acid ligase II
VPKGAWFDHDSLRSIAAAGGVISAPFDRKLSATPFAHAGYMGKLWDQVAWVSTYVLCPTPWTAPEMAHLARTESITLAGGAPTQWEKLLDVLEAEGGELPRFRVGVVATAPAPPPLIERVRAVLGCRMVVRYAMTESPSISGTEPEDSDEIRSRTVGRAQSGMTIRVLDEDRHRCAVGVVGDIEVSGACVMRGYWGAPELTADVLGRDGWLRTNDTGYVDQEGNLVVVGRRSEMYIRGGYNVYPLEVENVLLEHPDVAEVAIVGAPAPVIGEIGVAFVVATDPATPPSASELASWVKEQLADYKAPDEFRFLESLPRTRMFKIDKESLRVALAAEPPAPRSKPEPGT